MLAPQAQITFAAGTSTDVHGCPVVFALYVRGVRVRDTAGHHKRACFEEYLEDQSLLRIRDNQYVYALWSQGFRRGERMRCHAKLLSG